MSNFRVRQVLALRLPDRQNRFMVALATWMRDDTRTVRVGLETLIEDAGQARNTARAARRELETQGKLASAGGRGKGNLTVWTALCLPETASKGVSDVDPLTVESKGVSDVDPFTPGDDSPKGVNQAHQKGSTETSKRGQPQLADQLEPEMGFNRLANTSGSISLSLDDQLRAAAPGATEEEPDPDFVLLADAVPGADPRDVEWAITGLQYRKHRGEIRTTVRAYLRKIIENGDARSLVDDAAAERRRGEIDLAAYGDPFGGPVSPSTVPGRVVIGEVVQPAPPVQEPQDPPWKRVECPVCKAEPGAYCINAATHKERHQAAERAAAVTS